MDRKIGGLSWNFFGNIIKGIMIGIANIIPGVSGGTMAVSLGIYDRLIGSISGLFREFKKSILFLIPDHYRRRNRHCGFYLRHRIPAR